MDRRIAQLDSTEAIDAELIEITEALTHTRDDSFRAELLKARDDLLDLRLELPRQRTAAG
jgi:hypothetical protein